MTQRLPLVKKFLREQSVDAVLVSSLPNIIYLSGFSHFTPIEREGFLLLTKKNNYILTDGRYAHAVKTQLKNFKLLETSSQNSLEKLMTKTIEKEKIKNIGFESHDITHSEYEKLNKCSADLKPVSLSSLRIIKDKDEIEKITKACEIGDDTFSYIRKRFKTGMTEKQVAFAMELFIRKTGWDISFDTIVGFSENAAIPHHKTGERKLKKDDLILLDFGVQYKNYCSDMTRTIFFGKASKENKKIYQTVFDAQTKAAEYIQQQLDSFQPILAATADKTAREYIISQGYPTIPHSLGHGIGLEVHEAPRLSPTSKDLLTDGMVFSIEPGIYLPDNMGVRIEDLYTIQKNKLIQLTKSPKKLLEV